MAEYNLFPVRCYTCRKVLGHKYEAYLRHLRRDKHPNSLSFFQEHGIDRYCCRMRFLTHVDFVPVNNPTSTARVLDQVDYLKRR